MWGLKVGDLEMLSYKQATLLPQFPRQLFANKVFGKTDFKKKDQLIRNQLESDR